MEFFKKTKLCTKGSVIKMKKFEVSADSTCDLYAEEIKKYGVFVAPLEYTMSLNDSLELEKDAYTSFEEYDNFYDRLRKGYIAKTSILSVNAHYEMFLEMAKKGVKKAIHISQSYGLSPTLDNANKAIEMVKKEFPGINYVAIECKTTTCAEGFIVRACVKMRDEGKTLEETVEKINEIRNYTQHFIIANDLKFLARGGRISKASASIGSLLQVKPIIAFNKEGKLQVQRKEIGLKKAISSVVNDFSKYTLNKEFPFVAIVHTGNLALAEEMQKLFKDKYGFEPEIRYMGPVIAAHVGPNGVAYAFVSNEERPF